MKTIIIILWLLIGLIAAWRAYFGMLKDWYNHFSEDYREYDKGFNPLNAIIWLSPICAIGGLLSVIYWQIAIPESNWYFNPKKQK